MQSIEVRVQLKQKRKKIATDEDGEAEAGGLGRARHGTSSRAKGHGASEDGADGEDVERRARHAGGSPPHAVKQLAPSNLPQFDDFD